MEGATLEGMTALVLELQDEVKRLREALEHAMKHLKSDSCGKNPYLNNTLWWIDEALSGEVRLRRALSQKGADV